MMNKKVLKTLGALALGAAASVALVTNQAVAGPITISASIGGVPTGTSYENFDGLSTGASGGATSSGIVVSFGFDGQAVQGNSAGIYAAPFLSNNNGTLFGDANNGPDTTTYLTTGLGSATLTFPALEQYVGLLWGSVDQYNTLEFFNGATMVGSITGGDVSAAANGDQGANGTFYVNINSTSPFDSIVATSSEYAFEFDNVAFNPTQVSVSEPGALGTFGLALLMLGAALRLRGKVK